MSRIRHTAGRKRNRKLQLESLEARRLLAAYDFLRITEVMYNPPPITAAEWAQLADDFPGETFATFDSDEFEFIEIQNTGSGTGNDGSGTIDASIMGNTKLFKTGANGVPNETGANQGVAVAFPAVALGPGEFAVVVENATAFAVRYPGVPIAGQWSGGLSNNNEVITLGYGGGNPLWAQMKYDDEDPWPARADGDGSSLQMIDKAFVDPDSKSLFNPGTADPFQGKYKARNWMASRELKGSPGAEGLLTGPTVVINEVLANTYGLSGGLVDTIELYNTGDAPVDLTDYYLTDSKQFALKYQIDDGTIIPAGGYVVFDGWDFDPTVTANPNATRLDGEFGLSSTNGETISLLSELNGTVILVDMVQFDASESGISFGRMPNGSGELFPNAERTFGQRNDGHLLSDLVISEINYHPAKYESATQSFENALEYYEYIEILNRSDQPVDIQNWRLRGDIDFPVNDDGGTRRWLPSVTLAPDERILVLRFDPATDATRRGWFESFYGITLNADGEPRTPGGVLAVGEYWNLKPGQVPPEVPNDPENPTNVDALSNRQGRIELQEFVTVTTDPTTPVLDWDQFVLRDLVNYEDGGDWPNRADGNGSALELRDSDLFGNDPDSWRSSIAVNGTPGSASAVNPVVINEVLAHTDLPFVDAIELLNVTDQPVDISGWWLSDTNADLFKYQIPASTTIPADGYLVFDAWDFDPTVTANPNAPRPADEFGLNAAEGDDVWLTAFDTATGKPTAFADRVEFGPSFWGESFGRYPNGTGELFTNVSVTLGPLVDGTGYSVGLPNTGPKFGAAAIRNSVNESVVITEILFDPGSVDLLEYVEIYNDSNSSVNLNPSGRASNVGGGWHLDGFDFDFAVDTTLAPHEVAVVVPFVPGSGDDAMFRAAFNLDASVRLLGPTTGRLNNAGETLKLVLEDDEPTDWVGPPNPYLPLVVRDEVDYGVAAPWPTDAAGNPLSGTALSLTRGAPDAFGNFPASWLATAPTPGTLATIGDRYVFYNNSALDGDDPAANAADDGAIATDKRALLPGQTASSANVTSFDGGINGIMIDVVAPAGTITASDFAFRVGNNDDLASWDVLSETPGVTMRPGDGVGSSTRVTLIWDDVDIAHQWLEVTLKGGVGYAATTGLAEDDVFYFGNAVGDSGNDASLVLVNSADVIGVRDNPHSVANPAGVTDPFDFNRDGAVDAADLVIARNNATSPLTALRLITPALPLMAPASLGEGAPLAARVAAADTALAVRRSAANGRQEWESAIGEPVSHVGAIPPVATRLPGDVSSRFELLRAIKRATARPSSQTAEAVDSLLAGLLAPQLP